MSHEKFRFVPNWATLEPGIRAIAPESLPPGAFRTFRCGPGFTHDPVIIFEAARLLRHDSNIRFLLSGSGIG